MASEIIDYRGYELHIEPTSPVSKRALENLDRFLIARNFPYSENKTQREQMIAEAKAIVDTLR